MRGDGMRRVPPAEMAGDGSDDISDRELWRRSCTIDASEDEAAPYLDLAGFADGLLDPDERERVAERFARDPDAAADVAAVHALAGAAQDEAPPEAVIASARALVGASALHVGDVIAFAPRRRAGPGLHALAQWGSLAAAVIVAGWLGFTLGMDTSGAFVQNGSASDENFLHELLDPSTGLMRDLTEGRRT